MYYKKGDNKMKKRTISLLMSLVMMALLCYPAFAHTSLGDVEFLTPTSLDEFTVDVFPNEDGFFTQETADACDAMPEESDEVSPLATTVPNEVGIQSVKVNPIVACLDTNELFILNNIKRVRYWTYITQSDSLRLSPASVDEFIDEALTEIYSDSVAAQYTWAVIGWHIESEIALSAQKPLRVEYKPDYPRSGQTFETITKTVPYQYASLTLEWNFSFPANADTYYYMGFDGGFYFTYVTGPNAGKEGGLRFNPGVIMNY